MKHVSGQVPQAGAPETAAGGSLQPGVAPKTRDWLNRIMLAHGRDTWAEAAEIVLAAIAGDPADPVNAWSFAAEDVPAPPSFISGWNHEKGKATRFRPDTSICVRIDPNLARRFVRLTGLGLTASKAVATTLAVACRLDADARRYLPEARP